MIRRPPRSTLFPYRRSSDLARDRLDTADRRASADSHAHARLAERIVQLVGLAFASAGGADLDEHQCPRGLPAFALAQRAADPRHAGDRKSTRLNSSHSQISYAVFCLKKKKKCGQAGLRPEEQLDGQACHRGCLGSAPEAAV